jgi:hypothetical protein
LFAFSQFEIGGLALLKETRAGAHNVGRVDENSKSASNKPNNKQRAGNGYKKKQLMKERCNKNYQTANKRVNERRRKKTTK